MSDDVKNITQAQMIAQSAINVVVNKFKAFDKNTMVEKGSNLLVSTIAMINVELASLFLPKDVKYVEADEILYSTLKEIHNFSNILAGVALSDLLGDKEDLEKMTLEELIEIGKTKDLRNKEKRKKK